MFCFRSLRTFPSSLSFTRSLDKIERLHLRRALTTNNNSNNNTNNNSNNKKKNKMDKRLVWIDCEMTGLDVERDRLLEIALMLTDHNLKPIDKLDSIYIATPDSVLNTMSDWCREHFSQNGLTEECRRSTTTIEQADQMLADFLERNNINRGVLAGNSIATDRQFVNKYCPKFVSRLHYRMVDVSSIKVLVNMWTDDSKLLNKETRHRAMDDIMDSIKELQYYRSNYFNC